jgi:hypothetical protein
MKTYKYLFLIVLPLLVLCSCSQKITSKNLIGIWDMDKTKNASDLSMQFVDSNKIIFLLRNNEVPNSYLTYHLDNSHHPTALYIDGTRFGKDYHLALLVKIENNNLLKTQGEQNKPLPEKWHNIENNDSTTHFIRRK